MTRSLEERKRLLYLLAENPDDLSLYREVVSLYKRMGITRFGVSFDEIKSYSIFHISNDFHSTLRPGVLYRGEEESTPSNFTLKRKPIGKTMRCVLKKNPRLPYRLTDYRVILSTEALQRGLHIRISEEEEDNSSGVFYIQGFFDGTLEGVLFYLEQDTSL